MNKYQVQHTGFGSTFIVEATTYKIGFDGTVTFYIGNMPVKSVHGFNYIITKIA